MTQMKSPNFKVYTFSKVLHLAANNKLKERVQSCTEEIHSVLDDYTFHHIQTLVEFAFVWEADYNVFKEGKYAVKEKQL